MNSTERLAKKGKEQFNFVCPKEIMDRVRMLAEEEDRTVAAWILRALQKALSEEADL